MAEFSELLQLLEYAQNTFERNIPKIRQHLVQYLKTHMDEVASSLSEGKEVLVASPWGTVRLTKEDIQQYGRIPRMPMSSEPFPEYSGPPRWLKKLLFME